MRFMIRLTLPNIRLTIKQISNYFADLFCSCPLLMLHFLLNVTGIKLSEEYSLKGRSDAYRAYQRTTSAFVPWFKKT